MSMYSFFACMHTLKRNYVNALYHPHFCGGVMVMLSLRRLGPTSFAWKSSGATTGLAIAIQ